MAPRIRLPWFSYLSECFSSVSFAPWLLLPASKRWSVTRPEPAALLCPICTCSPGDPRRSHSLRDYLEPFLRALVSRLFPSQQVFLDHLLQHHTCPSFSVLFQPFGFFFRVFITISSLDIDLPIDCFSPIRIKAPSRQSLCFVHR